MLRPGRYCQAVKPGNESRAWSRGGWQTCPRAGKLHIGVGRGRGRGRSCSRAPRRVHGMSSNDDRPLDAARPGWSSLSPSPRSTSGAAPIEGLTDKEYLLEPVPGCL